jgi:Tol biopolymer transport system component
MKKYTYLPAQLAYENTMDEFRSYSSQSNNIDINWDYEKVSPPNPRAYTNYTYPNFIDTEKVLALKNGFDDTRTLVIVDKGTEQRLIKIAPVDRVNSNGEIVVWASESPDIRWAERSYSNIMVYNTGSNTLRILTHKGKYYAPAVSPDGSRIAAIEYGDDMRCRLVIVSITTGKEIARLLFDDRQFARMPSWSEDGQKIVFTVTTGQQRSISIYNIQDQSVHEMSLQPSRIFQILFSIVNTCCIIPPSMALMLFLLSIQLRVSNTLPYQGNMESITLPYRRWTKHGV